MRLEYLNTIIDSSITVLTEFTGALVERGDMKLRENSSTSKEVAAVIGMTGDVDGRIIIEMDIATAIAMVGLVSREPCVKLDRFALDCLMETANVMIARAVSSLNDQGFVFRLTPPFIFTGSNLSFFSSLNLETLVAPLHTNIGEFNLNVSFRMNVL